MNLDDIKAHLRANPLDAKELFESLAVVDPWDDCINCDEKCPEDDEDPCLPSCPNRSIGSSARYYGEWEACRISKLCDGWAWRMRISGRENGWKPTLDEAKAKCDTILRKNPRLILVDTVQSDESENS